MNQSVADSEVAEVWKDWHTVGDDFRHFENLPKDEQEAIMRGETVASSKSSSTMTSYGAVSFVTSHRCRPKNLLQSSITTMASAVMCRECL